MTLSDTALTEIKNIFTRFYTEPSLSTYTAVLEAYRVMSDALPSTRNTKYTYVGDAYERLLYALNGALADKIAVDERTLRSITTLTREQQQRLIQLR